MKKKRMPLLALVMSLVLMFPMSAFAQGEAGRPEQVKYGRLTKAQEQIIGTLFDADYYAATYPDVAATVGTGNKALLRHFLSYGIYEGRSLSAEFNVSAYKSSYADLQGAFGDDIASYYIHYVQNGKAEKRSLVTVEKAIEAGVEVKSAVTGNVVAKPEEHSSIVADSATPEGNNNQSSDLTQETSKQSDVQTYTEDESIVAERILALKESYSEGSEWNNEYKYTMKNYGWTGYSCAGFAFLCSDTVFENNKPYYLEDKNQVRVGDLIHDGRWMVVLGFEDDGIIITEGNYRGKVHWGRIISWDRVDKATEIVSRYRNGWNGTHRPVSNKAEEELQKTLEEQYIEKILELVNNERAKQNLSPLEMTAELNAVAKIRVEELTELYSHDRPDGRNCRTALSDVGISYTSFGENIAAGYGSPEDVVNAWMNSQGHRENILRQTFGHIGIGYTASSDAQYRTYWVQVFTN